MTRLPCDGPETTGLTPNIERNAAGRDEEISDRAFTGIVQKSVKEYGVRGISTKEPE